MECQGDPAQILAPRTREEKYQKKRQCRNYEESSQRNLTEAENKSVGELHEGEPGQQKSEEQGARQGSLHGWKALNLLNRRMIT